MICATLNCPLLKTAELTRPLSLKLNDFSWRASSHQPRRGERETDSQQALLLPSVLIVYLLLFESVWRRSGEGKRVPGWEGCDEKVMKPVTSYYSEYGRQRFLLNVTERCCHRRCKAFWDITQSRSRSVNLCIFQLVMVLTPRWCFLS